MIHVIFGKRKITSFPIKFKTALVVSTINSNKGTGPAENTSSLKEAGR